MPGNTMLRQQESYWRAGSSGHRGALTFVAAWLIIHIDSKHSFIIHGKSVQVTAVRATQVLIPGRSETQLDEALAGPNTALVIDALESKLPVKRPSSRLTDGKAGADGDVMDGVKACPNIAHGAEEAANILTTSDLDGADDIVELEFAPTRDFVPRWMNASAGPRRQSAPVTRGAPVQGGNRPHSIVSQERFVVSTEAELEKSARVSVTHMRNGRRFCALRWD